MTKKSVWTGIRRGLTCRCPVCGRGRLFQGFLKVKPHCEVCGHDNTIYPSDDLPPYLTILIVGHILVPLLVFVDHRYDPPMMVQYATWLPLAAIMCLGLLPRMKGAAVGLCWANGIVRRPALN